MYGLTRSMLFVLPVGAGVLAVLNSLDASRPVALAVMTVIVVAGVLIAGTLEERHGSFLNPPQTPPEA